MICFQLTAAHLTLINKGEFKESTFSKYMHKKLENLLLLATTSERSPSHLDKGMLHEFRRKLCVRMAISILCVAMNPSSVFLQTLIGLVCYAYGLSDVGFNVLNMFGCTCSIDLIRKHGAFWAKKRSVSDELALINSNFWRVSFDNLNFKIKFAKKLLTSGPNKMLNLITSQVCCCEHYTQPVSSLAYLCNTLLQPNLTRSDTLTVDWFKMDMLHPVFNLYNLCVHKNIEGNYPAYTPMYCQLRGCFPSFTPPNSDVVVYATVVIRVLS